MISESFEKNKSEGALSALPSRILFYSEEEIRIVPEEAFTITTLVVPDLQMKNVIPKTSHTIRYLNSLQAINRAQRKFKKKISTANHLVT